MTGPAARGIRAARIEWRDRVPVDADTGRAGWSGSDPLANADRLLVAGHGLPQRWAGTDRWTVLELGFGYGLDFVALLRRWRGDPSRPRRLFHVAIDARPVPVDALLAALDAAGVAASLSAPLVAGWPLPTGGIHRIELDGGRIVLMLALGEPARMLPQLALRADALYLHDRPGPGLDAAVQRSVVRAACARLVAGGTAVADGADPLVASAMAAAGLVLRPAPDAGGCGQVVFGTRLRGAPAADDAPAAAGRSAIVVGAGVAGSAIAFGLARRGWQVTVLDAARGPAADASGQPALAHHPSVSPDDAPLSRLTRSALLWARGPYDRGGTRWIGRLQIDDPVHARRLADGLPAGFATAVDAVGASELAGLPLRQGGLWLPLAGCADPVATCDAWIATAAARRFGAPVARLVPVPGGWRALGDGGGVLADAAIAVVAAAGASPGLLGASGVAAGWPPALQRRLGRSTVARTRGQPPRCVVGGDGYAAPLGDGRWLLGPYDDPAVEAADAPVHAWQRTRGWLDPASSHPLLDEVPRLEPGASGWRVWTPDHLPLIGPVPDAAALQAARAALHRDDRLPMPVVPGLWIAAAFGGRGLLWSVLAAEAIAAQLEREPAPLERELLRAIEPARFARRALRRSL